MMVAAVGQTHVATGSKRRDTWSDANPFSRLECRNAAHRDHADREWACAYEWRSFAGRRGDTLHCLRRFGASLSGVPAVCCSAFVGIELGSSTGDIPMGIGTSIVLIAIGGDAATDGSNRLGRRQEIRMPSKRRPRGCVARAAC